MPSDPHFPATPVRLSADDFLLAPFTIADVPALRAAFADPAILDFNPGPAASEGDAAVVAWLNHRNDWSAGTHTSWAIRSADDELWGSVSLFDLSQRQLCGEIGYWVMPAARGRRLATRAVSRVADFAFATLGLHRMYLHHAVGNAASCRVAMATGFELEGTLRQSYRYGDDRFHDEHLHGRLATDPMPGAL